MFIKQSECTCSMERVILIILVLCIVEISIASLFNESDADRQNRLIEERVTRIDARRMVDNTVKKKKNNYRSTSSSSGMKGDSDHKSGSSSIEISGRSSSTDTDDKKFIIQKKEKDSVVSTVERKGWRKWHRKCTPCPEELSLKWRDPRIKWICGGYQRARRSFKSSCMMYYRNCQDGTMFTKIHDGRCINSTNDLNQGDHFFYDYSVILSDESKPSKSSKETGSVGVSSEVSFDSKKYEIT